MTTDDRRQGMHKRKTDDETDDGTDDKTEEIENGRCPQAVAKTRPDKK